MLLFPRGREIRAERARVQRDEKQDKSFGCGGGDILLDNLGCKKGYLVVSSERIGRTHPALRSNSHNNNNKTTAGLSTTHLRDLDVSQVNPEGIADAG